MAGRRKKNYSTKLDNVPHDDELRKQMIEQFIEENLNNLDSSTEVMDEFDSFWEKEKVKAVDEFCQEESLVSESFKTLVDKMIYTNEEPLREDIIATMVRDGKMASIFKDHNTTYIPPNLEYLTGAGQ